MRCLYCGKELALLKRWTGGGEFCSDAHRQRYQEEYNQLALNRLLQAKPPNETPAEGAAKPGAPPRPLVLAEPEKEIPVHSAARVAALPPKPAYHEPAPQVAARVDAPVVAAPREVPVAAPVIHAEPVPVAYEEPAPAEAAGFLVELPTPLLAEVAQMSVPDIEFFQAVAAALPNHVFEPLNGSQGTLQLETAGLLTFQPSNRASNYTANGTRERRLEVRDFVRTAPIVEIDLSPAGETGLETSSEAMDILIFPQPPQGPPPLWQEPAVGFLAGGTELGELARLSFATTGFSDQADSDPQSASERQNGTAVALAEPPSDESPSIEIYAEAEPVVAAQVVTEVVMQAVPEAVPEVVPEPVVEAAPVPETFVESVPEPVVSQVVEPIVIQVVEPVEPAVEAAVEPVPTIPDPVTKPLPLVLQVTGPGKAKTVQVFSSASSSVALQMPRSTSLPLRPVMTFGPAPVAAAVKEPAPAVAPARAMDKPVERPVKSEPPRKPAVAPALLRSANAKPRQPEVKTDAKADVRPEGKPVVKAPQPEPVKQVAQVEAPSPRPGAKSDLKLDSNKRPEVKELKAKEEVRGFKQAESFMPAPLAAPFPESGDLGLPQLNLQSSQGFWGRLPLVAKIVIVVVLLSGVGGLIAYSSKSGSATVTAPSTGAGTLVTGSPLPVGDAGWITDWGSDPGVRRTRQISILRSSQTLTDYRIEMQGQIETKAIGWVFRAADPKNFYVTKLEIVKPGLQPTVALVRFAVINGEEQAHAQLPLPMKVRRDTMYKIRFDAVGSSFTTYVQDEKIDQWTDDHVKTGGVGLYSERGEVATLRGGMSVLPLMIRR
jgi:hypothetical protein